MQNDACLAHTPTYPLFGAGPLGKGWGRERVLTGRGCLDLPPKLRNFAFQASLKYNFRLYMEKRGVYFTEEN